MACTMKATGILVALVASIQLSAYWSGSTAGELPGETPEQKEAWEKLLATQQAKTDSAREMLQIRLRQLGAPVSVPSGQSIEEMNSQVQERLAELGYDPGPPDGVLGPRTRQAITAFQHDRGLPVDGVVTIRLRRALGLE